jgi:hypothetical protein
MNKEILSRRLFHRLERGFYTGEYIVLNDGYFFARFWADSDADAIRAFNAGVYMEGKQ